MSDEQKAVDYLKRALVDLNQTRRRLEEVESRNSEPIAIVGMSCRLPGGVSSPEDLWELVSEGASGISPLPEDRGWDLEPLRSTPEKPHPEYRGGFIPAPEFDAEFFGLEDGEALVMDPQHRLLLELAWEACERAGVAPSSLRGSDAGVFIGLSVQSYGSWLLGAVPESIQGWVTSGNSGSMASGRIAHILGLEGPAFTVDAACASSAVALHLASQSLRAHECSTALVGGITIMPTPWMYLEFSRQSLFPLSTDGECKSFADSADGATFSEGVGMIVLERLSDAHRRGHDVLAVIRGSALNQDGVSNGLTAPNGLAHERVMRQALENASLQPNQVDAVEGHGMGTVLGDPIEAQALLSTYGRGREGDPLWLGSVKSNIGHTQAASALAGVIKMAMAIRHERLPRTLHVQTPSRHVDWSTGTLSLLSEARPWPKRDAGEPRRAAVHSFGLNGTNVHLILEEPPPPEPVTRSEDPPAELAWIVSGRDREGMLEQARVLSDFLADRPELEVADVAHSLAVSRAPLAHRAVVLGASRQELLDGLRDVIEERPGQRAILPESPPTDAGADSLLAMAGAWVSGQQVDWASALPGDLVRLPTYAFRRRRYWPENSPVWEPGGIMGEERIRESDVALSGGVAEGARL